MIWTPSAPRSLPTWPRPAVDVALKVLNGEEVEAHDLRGSPTCSSKEEAEEKWYQPDQEGGFVCDWTDNNNTWNLTIEDVAPN